ncbi:unnamed protein product, partial [marine sediment metagenome]
CVDPWAFETGAEKAISLGASAKTDLQTAMTASQSWFAIGLQSPDDECPALDSGPLYSEFYSEDKTDAATPKPTLWVEYTPLVLNPPTDVDATDGDHTDKVVIEWTKSDGATGYKIYEGENLLDTLGDVATYDDVAAPAPTITAGDSVATDG